MHVNGKSVHSYILKGDTSETNEFYHRKKKKKGTFEKEVGCT